MHQLSYQRPFRRAHHGAHHAGRFLRIGDVTTPVVTTPAIADAIKPLTGFGWEWRADGVILTLTIDGAPIRVFMPLAMIWEALHREMTAVGCPLQGGVGEPLSVGSIFGSIAHAVSHAVSSVAHAVAPAIASAAKAVVHTAAKVGKTIVNSKIVRYGLDAAAVAFPVLAPAAAGLEAAHQALKYVDDGIAAAKQIKNGINTAANVAKVVKGLATQKAVADVVSQAKAGVPAAQRTIGAFQQIAFARAAAASPNPHTFLATVLQRSPQMAVHQTGLLAIAHAAAQAKMHGLRPYRVHARAA